jgi:hypothetical protein
MIRGSLVEVMVGALGIIVVLGEVELMVEDGRVEGIGISGLREAVLGMGFGEVGEMFARRVLGS